MLDVTADFLMRRKKGRPSPAAATARSGPEWQNTAVIVVQEQSDVETLVLSLAADHDCFVVVLYDPAVVAVARALGSSRSPTTALAAWKQQARALLSAYRAHRQRLIFASLEAVEADPGHVQALLARHRGIADLPVSDVRGKKGGAWSAWQAVLATQAVAADAEAVLLDGEFEAASLPLPPVACDPDAAFAELRAAEAARSLLLQQLTNVKDELREHFLASVAAQKLVGAERKHAAQEQERLTAIIDAAREDAARERERLTAIIDAAPTADAIDARERAAVETQVHAAIGQAVLAIVHSGGWMLRPVGLRRWWQRKILDRSGVLDRNWYLKRHRDVAEAKLDALDHYLASGAHEGRAASERNVPKI